ncbi:MAG: glycosyl transferase group 1 [Frankiales bacterium]|nr:glycosyl transferase group 1 [Frankiales bacterium]
MHVLLSHPFFWPHVARGAEREVHDIGAGLARRGHRVDLVTGQPHGLTSTTVMDGMRVRYVRTPLPRLLARRGLQREGAFGAVVAGAALFSRADVIACYHYADAVGAAAAAGRRPVVLKLTGTVPRDRVQGVPVERRLLTRAFDVADEIWVNSQYAVDAMVDWGRPMHVLPAGLDDTTFVPSAPRASRPTVLCASTPDEPRKRVVDLVDAWPAVLDALPEARLVLAGAACSQTRAALRERLPEKSRATVSFAGVLTGADLAEAYSCAHAVVAPSVYEALGLVTLEALACGTPVAGARSGATPELLDRPGTGVLFEPLDPQSCAEAVVSAVALADQPGVEERCRQSALRWALDTVVEQVDTRLSRLTGA